MPEQISKEAVEFITRLGGGILSSVEDIAFEWYLATHPEAVGKFPFTRLHPNLPSNDDLIVAGLAVPPWVIGLLVEEDGKKRVDTKAQELGKGIKEFGEGSLFYSLPMLAHRTAKTFMPGGAGARTRTRSPAEGAGSRRPAGIVYKL